MDMCLAFLESDHIVFVGNYFFCREEFWFNLHWFLLACLCYVMCVRVNRTANREYKIFSFWRISFILSFKTNLTCHSRLYDCLIFSYVHTVLFCFWFNFQLCLIRLRLKKKDWRKKSTKRRNVSKLMRHELLSGQIAIDQV